MNPHYKPLYIGEKQEYHLQQFSSVFHHASIKKIKITAINVKMSYNQDRDYDRRMKEYLSQKKKIRAEKEKSLYSPQPKLEPKLEAIPENPSAQIKIEQKSKPFNLFKWLTILVALGIIGYVIYNLFYPRL